VAAGALLPHTLFAREAHWPISRDPTCFGGFSDVFQAFSETGQQVALKRLRFNARGTIKQEVIRVSKIGAQKHHPDWLTVLDQRLCREALVWKQLTHPYILPFLGVNCHTFTDHPSLVSPWIANGTLLDYAREKRNDGPTQLRLASYNSDKHPMCISQPILIVIRNCRWPPLSA
jgi:serine/threonine protein kinase